VKLAAGMVVAERFRLVRELGEGGMGSVWLAHHVKLDMACAVKFIHADVADAEGVRERFEREAKIAGQLKSPHVVQVLDYGLSGNVPYIAMEFLEGEDLAKRLASRGRLGPDEAVAIVAQIARALSKAHAAGLVHRDLKPENVFLVPDDDHELVKVLDFGIAKAQTPLDAKTKTGALMGTPRFMSPEQAQGAKNLDHRSDLWSLAVITYRCVVGYLPFDSDAIGDLMMRIIVHPLPVPSLILRGLPPSFDAWWLRAAARDPNNRFQSAKEMAEALAAALGVASVASAGPAGVAAAGGATPLRMPTPLGLGHPIAPVAMTPASPAYVSERPPPYLSDRPPPASHNPGVAPTLGDAPPSGQTMNPASRTFSGPTRKKSATAPIVIGLLALAAGGVAAAVWIRTTASADGPAASVSATPAPPAPAPSEPRSAAANEPVVAPSASPEAPEPASAEPETPSATAAARPAPARPRPAHAPTPAPTRTGKVRIRP
jgi:serine/threonine protein kinase